MLPSSRLWQSSFFATLFILCSAFTAMAEESLAHFKNIATGSSLGFEIMWNGEPLQGQFETFDIDIMFHPQQLAKNSVRATIDLASLSLANDDVSATLPKKEWLHVDAFPTAIFQANQFEYIEESKYRAVGELTLKGAALPLALDFTLKDFSSEEAKIHATATLKRTDYHIGWKNTDEVANQVNINIELIALP